MNRRRRSLHGLILVVTVLALSMSVVLGRSVAHAAPSQGPNSTPIQNTLYGCTNPNPISPPYNPGTLICPDTDYVNSALKGWSDLDRVPFRLVMSAGNSAPSTATNYSVSVAVDNLTFGNPNYPNGVVGYDDLSQPTLNTAASDSSLPANKPRVVTNAACTFTATPTQTATPAVSSQHPINGSASQSLYWTITVSMAKGDNCVFDLYGELSAQADQVSPGRCDAKLHADLADASLNLQQTGAKEVPIQICDIHQLKFTSFDHNLSAQQTVDNTWTVANGMQPDHINFSNTCLTSLSGGQQIQVNVNWTKTAQPGNITIAAFVGVHNPANRTLYATVVDTIYNGTQQLNQFTFSGSLPPNSVTPAISTTFQVPPTQDVSQLNDQITVTYYNNANSNNALATLTGSDTAQLQTSQSNVSAAITNTETLTETDGGSSLQFDVEHYQIFDGQGNLVSTDTGGSFSNGYTLGTQTKQSVDWNYTATDSGSVTFTKTISMDTANSPLPQTPAGDLQDQTTLTPSTLQTPLVATSDVTITSAEKVTLTINKVIGNFTMGAYGSSDQPQTFVFDVQDPSGNDILVDDGSGNLVMPSITIASGTTGSVSIPGLDPGVQYTVTELQTSGWDAAPAPQSVTVTVTPGNPSSCTGATTFTNTIHANVTVQKITQPAGHEAGWTFSLIDPAGTQISQVTTTGAGAIAFPVNLTKEGQYTIQETAQTGWLNTAAQNATFVVDFPASGGQTYNAVFTNTQESASATVQKVTYPAGHEAGWSFTLYDPNGNAVGTATTTGTGAINFVDANGIPVRLTLEGVYTVKETAKLGWYNTASTNSTFTVAWPGSNNQTFNVKFTNTQCVTPTITASNVNGVATFSITDPNAVTTGAGLIGGSLPALNPLPLGTQYSNGSGISVVKLTNATMPAASWSDGAGSVTLTANKVNGAQSSTIGLIATARGGQAATVTVSSNGTVTVTNAGTCSKAFDPLLTSAIRQSGQPQTDTYTGIDKSESQLTVYNGQPGVSSMQIQVNGKTFNVGSLTNGQQKTLDISSALVAGGNNTITVTCVGKPGGSAVLLVAPPGN